jgi:hypothetical protein
MMDLLPDSRLKAPKNIQFHLGMNWVPIFCANCGADGGFVPAENMTFVCYLCQPCANKLPPIEGTYVMPDEVFFQKVRDAQMEKYGRLLTAEEIAIELQDSNSILSKLKKDGESHAIRI